MKKTLIIVGVIFVVALIYRYVGLDQNHPFWVDEFSAGEQAKLLLRHGTSVFTNPTIFFESHNITTHGLIALVFKFFGINEHNARIPSVLAGSLVPVAIFFLTKRLFGLAPALSASILTAFSYFQITWSRQARGYALLQLCVLLTFYLYDRISTDENSQSNKLLLILFFAMIIIGLLTHFLFYLLIAGLILHSLIYNRRQLHSPLYLIFGGLLLVTALFLGIPRALSYFADKSIVNNIWYYHSFLWREYGLLTFLGGTGFLIAVYENRRRMLPIIIYIAIHNYLTYTLRTT